ncbi:Protein kinase domain-containing protein [Mucilaginibacter pineti]|uniref:Protein kinase domain-containing protein n=1 Tax=Mucilaginibacter pineti TaxID=1391627 RepID=A0A1G7B3F9_9SPHI|nr:protein kinase [Mucilaginibacter pineti]SDE21377.1 Protein kinase domain-containing protein [Mucilaginibacter pineti]
MGIVNTAMIDNAAYALEGKLLKNKWKVKKRIEPKAGGTGGFFSVCYLVSDGDREAFLKAINFKAFFQLFSGRSIIEILSEQTNAFKFEKELLLRCKSKNLTKVSTILDEGEELVAGFTIANVPYLIFELADGDLRSRITFNNDVELAWKLSSLHNVSIGLKQLHGIDIGHQDLKPSNVLLYESGITSKIGDLGRSLCEHIDAPHEGDGNFTGDFSYAPPEFLYRFIEQDWSKKIRATDLYLFGSLVAFYFTGMNMTALIGKNIDRQFRWDKWGGSFDDVKDYLVDAFYKSINEIKAGISNTVLSDEIGKIIEMCCFPYPEKRGHPKSIKQKGNQYDFERITAKLDLLRKKAEMNVWH